MIKNEVEIIEKLKELQKQISNSDGPEDEGGKYLGLQEYGEIDGKITALKWILNLKAEL